MTGGQKSLEEKNPSKRLGLPEDIAGLVVFLSSRASAHINGATIAVDGGEVLSHGGMVESMKEETPSAKL
jgi:NAD(P)-dependent dehydrogenase (short-subunit alcohol dehydrogenase family)